MKHTPGPWNVSAEPNSPITLRANNTGGAVSGVVATVRIEWPHSEQVAEQEANAHLIAAAPDLLAALKVLEADITKEINAGLLHGDPDWGLLVNARAAIAKAEGREVGL